jgi:hypothetical protein
VSTFVSTALEGRRRLTRGTTGAGWLRLSEGVHWW